MRNLNREGGLPERFLRLCLGSAMVVLALTGSPGRAAASDLDFAKKELSNIGRSSMTNDQRKAMNLVDRYQRFKATEKRRAPASQAPVAAAGQASAVSENAGESPSRSAAGVIRSPIADGGALASFALTAADCSEMLLPISDKTMKKDAISRMQRGLAKLGFYHFDIDGVVGSRTRIALRSFCESARFALGEDIQVMLRTHLAIASAHPNWVATLSSLDFARWAQTQSDFPDIEHTRHLGDAKSVIALLERFGSRGKRPASRGAGEIHVSYGLTKDDIQQLKSSKEIVKRVQQLQSAKFTSAHDFEAGMEKTFKGISNLERLIAIVRENADADTSLSLTEQSFRRLKVKNVAPHIITAMETLRGLAYPNTELAAAVEQIVVGLQNGLKSYKPEALVGLAEFAPSGGKFTHESMKKFDATYDAADPMRSGVAARIRAMTEFTYQDKASMTKAMTNVLRQLTEEVIQVAPIIVAEADEVTEYSFGEEAIEEITERVEALLLPELYVDMLTSMEGIDYPTDEHFWAASRARFVIGDAENSIRDAIQKTVRRERATRVDDALLASLRDDKLPASIVGLLGSMETKDFSTTQALELGIDEVFVKLASSYEQFRPIVVAQAKKLHRFDKSKLVNWSGGGCNCSDPTLHGEVYGIYPHWLAGDPQEIDFSVTSRIGYFGLTFDDHGNIPDVERWQDIDTGFLRVARSHRVGIDLVFAKRDWRGWTQMGPQEKSVTVDTLVENVASLVTRRLDDVLSRMKPIISLGLSPALTKAQGVTLYLDGYPDDEASIETFDLLIRQLSERLQSDGGRYHLNLMFSNSALGRGIFQVRRLSRTLEAINSHSRLKSRLLILVQEPAEDNRAQVRARIEHELEGRRRIDVLRSVIMVLAADSRNQHRLVDNLTFADDNFGGVGFWTQPVKATGAGSDNPIFRLIKENYRNPAPALSFQQSAVCSYVCPNRWVFRIAWGVFLLLLLGAAAVYFFSCNYRTVLEGHFIWLVLGGAVPLALLTLLLLSCDPGWAEVSQGNDLLILVFMGVIAYALWNYRERKELIDLP